MSLLARPARWLVLVPMLIAATFLYGERLPKKVEQTNEPFNSFRSLDAQLSLLDGQFSQLKSEAEKITKIRGAKRRAKAYRNFRRSKTVKEIRSTASSIRATTRMLGSNHRMRKSRYGRVITRALRGRATSMKRALDRSVAARTSQQTKSSLQEFSRTMLAFVMQFQAASGGYGALQCTPGYWTCCSPKKVQAKGAAALNGCRWVCVKRPRRCRSGCLGPRTPVPGRQKAIREERRVTAAPRPRSP